MPLAEKGGLFTEPVFSPSHLHVMSIKTYRWPFSLKKNANACAHTSVTLCTIKEWGQGDERIEKTIL